MFDVADVMLKLDLQKESNADVPSALREGKSRYKPLGRYLTKKLRTMIGRDEKIPEAIQDQLTAEMYALQLDAKETAKGKYYNLKDTVVAKDAGKRSLILARHKRKLQRKPL